MPNPTFDPNALQANTAKRGKHLGGAWVVALLVWAPLAMGAKGCDWRTPETLCGGLQGLACDADEYCQYPESAHCGAADQTGVCTPVPSVCAEIYQPVCGCDDNTYGNACEAARGGISVAHTGPCQPAPGDTCGGLTGAACPAGSYCNYPPSAQCGAADQTGTCAPIPEVCTQEIAPVCGCDGNTYDNACRAALAGVSVVHAGECATTNPSGACGSRGLAPCPAGNYCDFPPDADCGNADRPGTCTAIPQACTFIYAPVCGCDGQTYSNACVAAAAGVSVARNNPCP
jgi:hypothetical protein